MKIPDKRECLRLLRKYQTPQNILAHCLAVRRVALVLALALQKKGIRINLRLLSAAALLHDVAKWAAAQSGANHIRMARAILAAEGWPEVGKLVGAHGFETILRKGLKSWEEKILFYADMRVRGNKISTLRSRFGYLRKRYPNLKKMIDRVEPLARRLEMEIALLVGKGRLTNSYLGKRKL